MNGGDHEGRRESFSGHVGQDRTHPILGQTQKIVVVASDMPGRAAPTHQLEPFEVRRAGWQQAPLDLGRQLEHLALALGLGATGGIATMAIIVVVAAGRTGFRFRPIWKWKHPVVRKLLSLSAWTLGFVVANQVALLVVRNLAEPGSSDASAYINAFTFFVLPHGLLAVDDAVPSVRRREHAARAAAIASPSVRSSGWISGSMLGPGPPPSL